MSSRKLTQPANALERFVGNGAAAQAAVDAAIAQAHDNARAAGLTPAKPKGKRGGRRPNQVGRPRELADPLSRTFTLERADHGRIEALAKTRGESLGKTARAVVAAGLEALGG